jgi:hypothetical protein
VDEKSKKSGVTGPHPSLSLRGRKLLILKRRRPAASFLAARVILNKRQFHQGHIGFPLSRNSDLSALEYRRSRGGVFPRRLRLVDLFKSRPSLGPHYATLAGFSNFHAPFTRPSGSQPGPVSPAHRRRNSLLCRRLFPFPFPFPFAFYARLESSGLP